MITASLISVFAATITFILVVAALPSSAASVMSAIAPVSITTAPEPVVTFWLAAPKVNVWSPSARA